MPSLRAAISRNRRLIPSPEVNADEAADTRGDTVAGGQEDGLPGVTLYQQRLDAVLGVLLASGARRVLDLGCGQGRLLEALARDERFDAVTGVDYSREALDAATRRLKRTLLPSQRGRVTLIEGLLTYRNPAFLGFDAAAAVEVIEHLPEPQLAAFESAVFGFAHPQTIVVTTPNREYNVLWRVRTRNGLRQENHRFEWTRGEFSAWACEMADRHDYKVTHLPVGSAHPTLGPPTQMVVFGAGGLPRGRGDLESPTGGL
jgi:3' terminal RNA ribose 2'-O-methyltransferase Hen1